MHPGGWFLQICENAVWIKECAGNFSANEIFKEDFFEHVLILLDDLLVYSEMPAEQLEHLEKVFVNLRAAGLKLKLKKCDSLQTQLNYLGHVLDKTGIRPNPKKKQSETGNVQRR